MRTFSTLPAASGPAPPGIDAPRDSAPVQTREPSIPPPECYTGEIGACSRFLLQCSLIFDQQPTSYATDRAKLAFLVNLLRGRAGEWANSLWEAQSPVLASFATFTDEMKKVFDQPFRNMGLAHQLLSLRQKAQSVAEFSIEFRILASESGWNELALKSAFLRGLSNEMRDQLATWDEPDSLESLINLAIRIDNRLWERRKERKFTASPRCAPAQPVPNWTVSTAPVPSTAPEDGEPMQLGRTRLSSEERSRRVTQGCCIYCGQSGHFISQCPVRPKNARAPAASYALVSDTRVPSTSQHRVCLPAHISCLAGVISVGVLVDSGADENFIDREFAQTINCPLTPVNSSRPVKAINNSLIETVTHQTAAL